MRVDNRRNRWLVAALLLLLVGIAVIVSPDETENPWDRRSSSFHSSPAGTRALLLTLQELGIAADARLTPFVGADSLDGPLALIAPSQPPTPAELRALKSWLRRGGTLIYAAGRSDPTLDSLGLVIEPVMIVEERRSAPGAIARAADAHSWTHGVAPVPGFRRAFADSSAALQNPRAVPLLETSRGEVVVVLLRVGAGRVIAWSDPGPLTNSELRAGGAAHLFARAALAATGGSRALRFDEYHHGYREGGGPVAATITFLRRAPAGHAVVQLAAAGLGLLLLLGSRFGAPHAAKVPDRRSPLEHVDALSAAYKQAGARRTARRILVEGFARRLRLPPPAPGAEGEFLEELSARYAARAPGAESWAREDGAGSDLTRFSREMDKLFTAIQQR